MPRRVRTNGRLQANVHEFPFKVDGNLTLESFLMAWANYQATTPVLQQRRHPKFLRLLASSDPANILTRQLAHPGYDIRTNYDFHMITSAHGPEILGADTLNGLYFHIVMHRFVPDHDQVNNVLPNVDAHRPLERYANYDTYMKKTWPFPRKLAALDVEGWIECGNPPKVMTTKGFKAQQPSNQDQSEDDDSDDEEQRSRYLNRKRRRIAQQFPTWKTEYLRAATHTEVTYHRALGKIENENITDRDQLEALGRAVEARYRQDAIDQAAGAVMIEEGTYLEQLAAGTRLYEWYRVLPGVVVGDDRELELDEALPIYWDARDAHPNLVTVDAILEAARLEWIGGQN